MFSDNPGTHICTTIALREVEWYRGGSCRGGINLRS